MFEKTGCDFIMLDNIVVRALFRLCDLLLLNVLWVICSIPVITIGASTTALYTVTLKMVTNDEGYIIRDFRKAFVENFKQSTVIWGILLFVGSFMIIDFVIMSKIPGVLKILGMICLGMAALFYITEVIFIFPLIAKFKNTTVNMLKNGLLIPISRLGLAFIVMMITGVCIIATFFNITTVLVGAVVWTLIGGALLTYINSFFVLKMLEPYF